MVKDLKGILGMVSLDIYQITNLFKFFKRAYHLLNFQKTWIFHEHPKCDCMKPGFISKLDYLKYQCFGSTGLEDGKMFIRTGLFPTMITNFQV